MKTLSRRAAFAVVLSVLLLTASCQAGFLFDIWEDLLTPFLDVSPSAAVLTAGQHLTLTAIGGRGPYSFIKTGGAGTLTDHNDGTAEYLADGGATTASILLSDSRGEEVLANVQVNAVAIPQLYILPSNVSLAYGGSVSFGITGGAPDYIFDLVSGAGTLTDYGDGTADYTAPASDTDAVVQVEDSSGQAAQASVTVRAAPPPLAIVPVSVTLEEGTAYTFTATGGSGSYTFSATSPGLVDNGDGTADFTALSAPDIVTVTVDDTIDTADATVTVVVSLPALTIVPQSINVSFGATFQFEAEGGQVPPPDYVFSMGTTYGGTVTPAGLYTAPSDRQGVETVVVTDGRGITDTATVKVKKK